MSDDYSNRLDEPSIAILRLNSDLNMVTARLAVSEQLNAELARMLKDLEWAGMGYDGSAECPVCSYMPPPVDVDSPHDPDCALAALLKKARAE